MENEIKKAIKNLSGKIDDKVSSPDALHYTQAILNLANAKRALKDTGSK